MSGGSWDPGLQPERTALAWQRTSLALLAGNLVLARLLVSTSVVLAVLVGLAAAVGSLLLSRSAVLRHQATETALRRRARLPDARAHLTVAALTCLLGVSALLYLIIG